MLPLSSTTITLFEWIGSASLLMAVASLLVTPWFLTKIPADYFRRDKDHLLSLLRQKNFATCCWLCFKNFLGVLLCLIGIAMLVLPGQGLLTILMGLSLIDFPKKRALEAKIILRPKVLAAINWLRRKRGRPDLLRPFAIKP